MADVISTQTLHDGPKKVVVKLTGVLDTANAPLATLLDPALLTPLEDAGGTLATKLIIDKISYNISSPLVVNLLWDATTDVPIVSLVNSGDDICAEEYGGLWNNAGTGVTGKILYSTTGFTAGPVAFNVILECRKK